MSHLNNLNKLGIHSHGTVVMQQDILSKALLTSFLEEQDFMLWMFEQAEIALLGAYRSQGHRVSWQCDLLEASGKFLSDSYQGTNVKTKTGYGPAMFHSLAPSLAQLDLSVLNSCVWYRREVTHELMLLRNNVAQGFILLHSYSLNGLRIRLLFRN